MQKIVRGTQKYCAIPMEIRFSKIMEVLNSAERPLSAQTIADTYIQDRHSSDVTTTQMICNLLCLAGVLARNFEFKGKSTRSTYRKLK